MMNDEWKTYRGGRGALSSFCIHHSSFFISLSRLSRRPVVNVVAAALAAVGAHREQVVAPRGRRTRVAVDVRVAPRVVGDARLLEVRPVGRVLHALGRGNKGLEALVRRR